MKATVRSLAIQDILFYLLLLIGLGWLVFTYRILFGPLITASLLAYLLYPVVTRLSKRSKINRRKIVILVYIIFLALLLWAVIYLGPILLKQAARLDSQVDTFRDQISSLLLDLNLSPSQIDSVESVVSSVEENISQSLAPDQVFRILIASTTNIVWLAVVLITTFHLLRDWERLREWIFRWVPGEQENDYRTLHAEIKKIWQSYLRGQLRIMLFLGVFSGVGAAAIGLPYSLLLGFLAGALALIPSLGPALATAIAALVAWTQGSSYLEISNFAVMLLAIGVFQIAQLIEGFWLTPRIMGKRMNLHPGVVLIAVMGTLFTLGALITLIIVPIIGTIILVLDFIRRKRRGLDPWPDEKKVLHPQTEAYE